MRAGMQMLRTSGISLDAAPAVAVPQSNQSSNPNGPAENVVQILLNDIRITMAKDPSKSYSARLGRSAADTSRDKSVTSHPSDMALTSLLSSSGGLLNLIKLFVSLF